MKFLRTAVHRLFFTGEKPERIALAYSIGVFISFSPLLGLHTVLGLLSAVVFRLNKLAVLLGVCTNSPWLVAPFYAFATWLGMKILGTPEMTHLPEISLLALSRAEFWQWLAAQWRFLIPAVVGSTILSTVFACLAYLLVLYAIRRRNDKSGKEEAPSSMSRICPEFSPIPGGNDRISNAGASSRLVSIFLVSSLCLLQTTSGMTLPESKELKKDEVALGEAEFKEGALQNIHLETSHSVFMVMAALNIAGFDYEEPGKELSEFRQRIREDLVGLDEGLRSRLQTFYQAHRQGEDEARQQAAYVSLALLLSPPPDFALQVKPEDLPTEVSRILGFADLVKEFYQQSVVGSLWLDYRTHYQDQLETYRPMMRSVVRETLRYFRISERVSLDRRIVLIPDLLNVTDIVNARNWSSSYIVVLGPTESPQDNYIHLQHEYLHFLLDPLILKFNSITRRRQGLLAVVREQPQVKPEYVKRFSLVTTESLIESILLRLHPNQDLGCSIVNHFREGLILLPYFFDRLEEYEQSDLISFPVYLNPLLQGIPDRLEGEQELKQWRATCTESAPETNPQVSQDNIQTAPATVKDLLGEVTQLLKEADFESARIKAQDILEREPENASAQFYLAQIATRQGQHELAFEYDNRVVESPDAPEWIRAWCLLRMGRFLAHQGRFEEAQQRFDTILRMDGDLKGAREKAEQDLKDLSLVNK